MRSSQSSRARHIRTPIIVLTSSIILLTDGTIMLTVSIILLTNCIIVLTRSNPEEKDAVVAELSRQANSKPQTLNRDESSTLKGACDRH